MEAFDKGVDSRDFFRMSDKVERSSVIVLHGGHLDRTGRRKWSWPLKPKNERGEKRNRSVERGCKTLRGQLVCVLPFKGQGKLNCFWEEVLLTRQKSFLMRKTKLLKKKVELSQQMNHHRFFLFLLYWFPEFEIASWRNGVSINYSWKLEDGISHALVSEEKTMESEFVLDKSERGKQDYQVTARRNVCFWPKQWQIFSSSGARAPHSTHRGALSR